MSQILDSIKSAIGNGQASVQSFRQAFDGQDQQSINDYHDAALAEGTHDDIDHIAHAIGFEIPQAKAIEPPAPEQPVVAPDLVAAAAAMNAAPLDHETRIQELETKVHDLAVHLFDLETTMESRAKGIVSKIIESIKSL